MRGGQGIEVRGSDSGGRSKRGSERVWQATLPINLPPETAASLGLVGGSALLYFAGKGKGDGLSGAKLLGGAMQTFIQTAPFPGKCSWQIFFPISLPQSEHPGLKLDPEALTNYEPAFSGQIRPLSKPALPQSTILFPPSFLSLPLPWLQPPSNCEKEYYSIIQSIIVFSSIVYSSIIQSIASC